MAMFLVFTDVEYVSLGQKHENLTTKFYLPNQETKSLPTGRKKIKKEDRKDNSIIFSKALFLVFLNF